MPTLHNIIATGYGQVFQWDNGRPVDGIEGIAPGAISVDVANGLLYYNSGTAASSTWLPLLGVSAQKVISIPLTTIFESDGTNTVAALGPGTTPVLDMANGDTDSALTLSWAAANNDAVITNVIIPPDFDKASDMVIHFRAAMAGATDTPTLASDVYFNEGDTKVEDVSAAITGTSYAEYTITVAAADIPAGAQTCTIELTPGAHTTDIAYITAVWVEYTGQTLTS